MKLENLSDDQLTAARDGQASQILHQRQQRRREQQAQQQAQQAEQTAKQSLRALSDDELATLAEDPRRSGSPNREREAWALAPREIWAAGWSKDETVASAKHLLAHRQEMRAQAVQQRQSPGGWQGPLGTVNLGGREVPVLYLAGGAVAAGAVAKAATGE